MGPSEEANRVIGKVDARPSRGGQGRVRESLEPFLTEAPQLHGRVNAALPVGLGAASAPLDGSGRFP